MGKIYCKDQSFLLYTIVIILCTAFFDIVYSEPTAEEQNIILTNYMAAHAPARQTSTKEKPRNQTTVQYCVRKANGELVVVCAKTFQSITTMGKITLQSTLIFSKMNTFLAFFCLFLQNEKD